MIGLSQTGDRQFSRSHNFPQNQTCLILRTFRRNNFGRVSLARRWRTMWEKPSCWATFAWNVLLERLALTFLCQLQHRFCVAHPVSPPSCGNNVDSTHIILTLIKEKATQTHPGSSFCNFRLHTGHSAIGSACSQLESNVTNVLLTWRHSTIAGGVIPLLCSVKLSIIRVTIYRIITEWEVDKFKNALRSR